MRVFIGYADVAGYLSGLKQGFDRLGVTCFYANIGDNLFAYAGQSQNWITRTIHALRKAEKCCGILTRILCLPLRLIMHLVLLIHVLLRYDVVIQTASSSLFKNIELPLYRLFGVKLIVVFLGSESRPAYISGVYADNVDDATLKHVRRIAKAQQKTVRKIGRYADIVIDHSANGHFHARDFVPYLSIGFPVKPVDAKPQQNRSKNLRILHAPSRPIQKGSPIFRSIIDTLKDEGHKLTYIELINVPNARVLEELAQCDFVLDELYSDITLAGFACEAASYGKAAVVGSYRAPYYQAQGEPPAAMCLPEEAEEVIRQLVSDENFRRQKGQQAQNFVRQQWAPETVAGRYQDLIDNAPAGEALFNPADTDYLYGWGMSHERLHKFLQAYTKRFGYGALYLDDKPELLARYKDFIEGA